MSMLKIYKLDDYALTYSEFLKIGNTVKVSIRLKYPDHKNFFLFKPEDRWNKIKQVLEQRSKKLVNLLPHKKYKIDKIAGAFRGIEIDIQPRELKKFENKSFIDSIWIKSIYGIKQKPVKKTRIKTKYWYNVKAIFAIQIEGTKGGLQRYEERMLLVKAQDHIDAEKVAIREFKEYGKYKYLNENMQMVRWYFDKITDICELDIENDKLDPTGTEVYSKLRWRKFRPEYEWYPIKKYKKA